MKFLDFYDRHVPALSADAPRHYMLLNAIDGVRTAPTLGFRGWDFGEAGRCAIRPIENFAVMLGESHEDDCQMVAETVAAEDVIGVMGPGDGPDWFTAHASARGLLFEEPLRNRIYVLTEPLGPTGVAGDARLVTKADTALFSEWMRAYLREALPLDPMPHESWLERWAGEGDFRFWTVKDEPVAMAGVAARSGDIAAIRAVYTPPVHRGRGYARAITAAATNAIFEEGCNQAVLMVNVKNAPAERCYLRLGFQHVCGFTHTWRKMA